MTKEPDDSDRREADGPAHKVGYGQPPLAYRFKPKQSGNPKGRPKGAKNLRTLVRDKLDAKVLVREAGKKKRMSKAEIGVTKLVNRFAETGDPKIAAMLVKLLGDSGGSIEYPTETQTQPAEHPSDADILQWFLANGATDGGDDRE